jgi:hypothetical protein
MYRLIKSVIVLLLLFLTVSCDTLVIDNGVSAVVGKDSTGPIRACGNQPIVGYTYCRKKEGSAAGDRLWFYGPKTNCERQACVYFKIYFPDGTPSYEGSIPKNETKAFVLWSDLIKSDTFVIGDRGFWPYVYTVYWNDDNGNERSSRSDGDIRLRVYHKDYEPLHNSTDNPNFTFEWTDDGHVFKVTTGLRMFIGEK